MRTIGEVFGGGAPAAPQNPFTRDEHGKLSGNITEISTLCRTNPRRAIELCKAAGENLDLWFPTNPL